MKPVNYKENVVITATELKQNLGKYLDFVEQQNEVVVTKNGKKICKLTPYVTDMEQYFLLRERALDCQYGGKKVSYEEFMEIYEKSDLRMEFINGEIYLLSSPNIGHQRMLGWLYLALNEYFKDKKYEVFFAPFDVHFRKKDIEEPDVMQPDLIVACDVDGNVNEKCKYMGTPTLVVEILSDSTRSKDMVEKLNTYMLSGVKEYWIIDPIQEHIVIYTFANYEIERYKFFKKEEAAQSFIFDGLALDVSELFHIFTNK
ncbi:MAG TPA: type II toxin-antitoxin system Phd/YefM family antitoxin [Clostridiaceae bacterium]|nr:type II toxin-antitoxin system Phd/YefM family antitoxin [Clostridiaceae bacterium]